MIKNKELENVLEAFKDIFESANDYEVILTKKGYYFLRYEIYDGIESGIKILNGEQLINELKREMLLEFETKLNKHKILDNRLSDEEKMEFEKLFSTYYNFYLSLDKK